MRRSVGFPPVGRGGSGASVAAAGGGAAGRAALASPPRAPPARSPSPEKRAVHSMKSLPIERR